MAKRGLPSTQSTQSTQSSSDTRPPPTKRAKITSTSNPISTTSVLTASTVDPSLPSIPNRLPLPSPPKRKHHQGSLRRLAISSHSTIQQSSKTSPDSSKSSKVRPKSTLNGSKVGGKSKDLKDGVVEEEIWVNRTVGKGLGFAGYLKKGVQAVVERGMTTLRIHGMGAAIPLALSLSMAIRDAIPGGGGDSNTAIKMEVRTGSIEVADEITPLKETEDIVYQTRVKSTVEIVLRVSEVIGLNSELRRSSRGSGGDRGSRRRGGGGNRGRGRGRGGSSRGESKA